MILDLLNKSSHETGDFSKHIDTLLLMKSKEQREEFLNQPASFHSGQTVAQKIYEVIYGLEEKEACPDGKKDGFDPFHSGIDKYVKNPEIAQELRDILKVQRATKQSEIKQKAQEEAPFVYHISNVSPETIKNGVFEPREQKEHFQDQGLVKAVFASSDNSWAMALKVGAGVSTSISGIERKIVIVSDRKKFMDFKFKNPYAYQYKFPVELFEPNVGYNGHFTGEWYCLDKAVKINTENLERRIVDEVIGPNICLYFTAQKDLFSVVRSDLKAKRKTVEDFVENGMLIPYKKGDLEKYLNQKERLDGSQKSACD